jgi:RND family efflux transporter MFP subunit
VPVETQTISPTSFRDIVQVTGSVEAINDATISAETSGRVEMLPPLGSYVDSGDVVARINDRLLEASLNAARSQYRLAEDTYQRQKALHEDSVISAMEFDNARSQWEQARAQLDHAREQLANARPRSPFAGRIEERNVEEGEYVGPGTPLVRIVDTRRVKVTAGVPERYINDIREGTSATVRFQSVGLDSREGRVTFAGRTIRSGSRTFPVEIELNNSDDRVSPQMVSDVRFTREILENVLVVPQSAIVRDENNIHIYTVEQQGDQHVAVRNTVTLGPSGNGRAVVESGLGPGARVITNGQSQVTDGDPVRITQSANELATTSSR